jgi:hypothetical protein
MSVNAAAIAAARKRSGPRGKRPLWITVLLVIGAGVVWFLQQNGVLPQGSSTSSSTQQSSSQPAEAPSPRGSEPQRVEASKPAAQPASKPASKPTDKPATDGGIADLFKKQQSDTWIEAEGVIKKILPDDNDDSDGSSKHQRWIVRVPSGIEILIAHAFDVSARVPVEEGDTIRFRGEYEYTEKGGTVHFTHAPKFKRREPGGWIEHNDKLYE